MSKSINVLVSVFAACFYTTAAKAVPIVPADYSIELYASGMGAVSGVAFAPDGSLMVSDYAGGRILKVASNGTVQAVASGLPYIIDVAYTSNGALYAGLSGTGALYTVDTSGTATAIASGFSNMATLAVMNDELYVGSPTSSSVSRVDAQGYVSAVIPSSSGMTNPYGISFDSAGTMYFVDHPTGGVYAFDFQNTPQLLTTITPYGGLDTGIGFGNKLFRLFVKSCG